jgi:branched-chain amino acid transport system ATP-binding protein
MSEPLLVVETLGKRFGGLAAVVDVTIEIPRGIVTGLIGPNGAGKTTLFSLISGSETPSSGRILFEGRDVTRLPPHARAALGVGRTFQITQPFAGLSVRENIAVGAYLRHPRREDALARAAEIAEQVGLKDRLDAPASSLTVSARKRLEVARALATEPKILLLDEPAAGMNPNETHEVTELIGRLRDELSLAILVIEHDMHVVEGVSDRVVALDHGVTIAQGGFDEVASHPAVVEAYLGRDPEALAETSQTEAG